MEPEPDNKDWTWTLRRRCPDCGLEAGAVDPTEIPAAPLWRPRNGSRSSGPARRWPGDRLRMSGHRSSTALMSETASGYSTAVSADAGRGRPCLRELGPERDGNSRPLRRAGSGVVADELEAAAEAFVARLASVDRAQLGRGTALERIRVHRRESQPVPARCRPSPLGRDRPTRWRRLVRGGPPAD